MAGRPPADPKPLIKYLIEHGPKSSGELRRLGNEGVIPLSGSTISRLLPKLRNEGLIDQSADMGDYYPNHNPDTGEPLEVMIVTPEERMMIEALRTAKAQTSE